MAMRKANPNPRMREKDVLDFMTELLALDRLEDILRAIVRKSQELINSCGCSIYLVPRLVKQYNGKLIDASERKVEASEFTKDIIVLAAASDFRDLASRIGKYFYTSGEGLTGWVFENKKPLRLSNITDEKELQKYLGLKWIDKYGGAEHYYSLDSNSPKPFLAVPLVLGNKCYGVIRVGTSQDGRPFPSWAEGMFFSFGKVVSRCIEKETIIEEQKISLRKQKRAIENLINIGSISTNNKNKSFRAILEETQKIVGASMCCLYLPDRYGETVRLEVMTSSDPKPRRGQTATRPTVFRRGEGLTGWIFNTGKPLLINETSPFSNERTLTPREIRAYSGSSLINSEDMVIGALKNEVPRDGTKPYHFMGVPLLTKESWTQGVLSVWSRPGEEPFTRLDLRMLRMIAANISKLLANLEQQELNKMLIALGQEHGDRLFQHVVEQMPRLVLARGCSIFLKSNESGMFHLKYTNSPQLMLDRENKDVKELKYKPGSGKTGLVAKLGRSLVINHYGVGSLDRRRLEKDYKKYSSQEKYRDLNLVGYLKDSEGVKVGLARLVRNSPDEQAFDNQEKRVFKQFLKETVFKENGLLPIVKSSLCEEGGGGFTKSFLACPLRNRQGNIFGVLRIPRTFPGGVFTDEALELTASVCNRLSAVIDKEKSLEQHLNQNLKTLSDINTQMNASFGARKRNRILKSILKAATQTLGFEFSTLQLVNQDDNTIYTAMTMVDSKITKPVNPKDWIKFAKHPLDPPDGQKRDIHAWLLREHKKVKIIKGWDEHLDRIIYDMFDHKNLVRAFIPIVSRNPREIIGTIEAGYHIDRKSDIDNREVSMLKALADQAAIVIRNHRLQEKLVKAELLQLVPFMSHILKTPAVQLLMQLGEMLKEVTKDEPNVTELKEVIDMASRPAMTIYSMSSTLAVEVESREKAEEMRITDRVDIIKFIKELLRKFMLPRYESNGSGVEIKINSSLKRKVMPLSKMQSTWFEVILLNLLHNAIKFSPPGGIIHINCQHDPASEDIVISIMDEGPGIAAKVLPELFKLGVRTKAKGWPDGSGIGLYTVKRLVDELGWTCQAENLTGRGARFDVTIPRGWGRRYE